MSRSTMINWLLVLAVLVLAAVPLLMGSNTQFGGADGVAAQQIVASNPGFQPWFTPFFQPAPETASGLFALQAAIGAGFLGYFFGVARTRRRLARD
jgi:cobalt/nickel transport protein